MDPPTNTESGMSGYTANMKRYRSRFAIERDGDGWTLADYQRGGCVSFTTRAEAREALRFVKAYAAKWGDVDLESFPYSLDEPFTEGDA